MLKRTALLACPVAGLLLAACGSSSSSSGAGASSSGSLSAGAGAGSDYCTIAKSLTTASNGLSSLSPTSDVGQVKALIAGFAAQIDAAAAAAPSAAAADWNTLKTAYDSATAAVQSAKTTADVFSLLATKFNSPAISTAGKNVDTATQSACGFTIGGSSSSSTAATAPPAGTTDTGSSSSTGTETSSSSTSS